MNFCIIPTFLQYSTIPKVDKEMVGSYITNGWVLRNEVSSFKEPFKETDGLVRAIDLEEQICHMEVGK